MHEAQEHEFNSFVTLTYDQENIPEGGSLDVRDWQLFAKRARRAGHKFRFYHCGEYGDLTRRPHYHAALFGLDFHEDRREHSQHRGNKLYTSPRLTDLWGKGHALIGALTFQSAAYVARYIMKKRTGQQADTHYDQVDPATGEVRRLSPEYTTMSRRPGIGKTWFDKYATDVYPSDFVVVNGHKARPPAFYDSQFEVLDPVAHAALKSQRQQNAEKHRDNNTPERLKIREECQTAKIRTLKRDKV